MKRRILTGFAVILLAITMVMGCSGGGGGGSSTTQDKDEGKLDKGVDLSVPDISKAGNFSLAKNYSSVTTEAEAKLITGGIFEEGALTGLFSLTQSSNILYNRNSASRKIQSESIRQNFTEKDLADDYSDEELKHLKINGYVDATYKYDDAKDDYFSLNGVVAANIKIEEGFNTDDDYETIGVIAGKIEAKKIEMRGETISGSIIYNINGAINIAYKGSDASKSSVKNKYVKCTFKADYKLDLNSEAITITIDITAYGAGSEKWTYKETIDEKLSDYM